MKENERTFDAMLRKAYEAGRAVGRAEAEDEAKDVHCGESVLVLPTFEDWRAGFTA